LHAELNALPPDEWPTRLRRLISEQVSLILRRSIDPDHALSEYGLDSLGSLELRTRIETETGIRISPSEIAAATIRDLAEVLCQKLANAQAASVDGRSDGDVRPNFNDRASNHRASNGNVRRGFNDRASNDAAQAASFNDRASNHRPSSDRASNGVAQPDNRLALLDHAFFAGQRALGQEHVIQVVWVYEHAINFDGLRRFHHNLGYGLLGRRIERSPLPFARHRWVSDQAPSDIEIAERARPRAELSDWADERSRLPVDAEWGPGWHLGVLPLKDGSTAVSLVVSHDLIDGLGLAMALADAAVDNTRDLGLPPPRSRTRLRAVLQDARQTAQDVPEAARALMTAAKLARRHRHGLIRGAKLARRRQKDSAQSSASRPVAVRGADGDEPVIVPGITVYIDADDWDARARALGGTSGTLFAGLAAKLGERMGRQRAGDGAVTLQLPLSNRAEGDTRAIVLSYARVSVDPTRVTTDLRDIGAAVEQSMSTQRNTPDESSALHWLSQFAPKRALKRLNDVMVGGDPDLPVFCSNLGDLSSLVCCLDGTDAEYATTRGASNVTRQWLERTGGELKVQSGRVGDKICITVLAYQPGAANTKPALRELAARTLADFDLNGEID
jgi:polyketide synthase 5